MDESASRSVIAYPSLLSFFVLAFLRLLARMPEGALEGAPQVVRGAQGPEGGPHQGGGRHGQQRRSRPRAPGRRSLRSRAGDGDGTRAAAARGSLCVDRRSSLLDVSAELAAPASGHFCSGRCRRGGRRSCCCCFRKRRRRRRRRRRTPG